MTGCPRRGVVGHQPLAEVPSIRSNAGGAVAIAEQVMALGLALAQIV